jgi:hypothetical protein
MNDVEFTTEGSGSSTGPIPKQAEADDPDDADWRAAAYEQFLRDDSPEDAGYEEVA